MDSADMNVKENIHNIHRSNFQKGRGDGRKNMLCDFFKKLGHLRERCFKLYGYPTFQEFQR